MARRHTPEIETHNRPSPHLLHRGALWAAGLVVLLVVCGLAMAGCGFDPVEIDERRCKNDDACFTRLGLGWSCIQGYCQVRKCDTDDECDDRLFCTGTETCDPTSSEADGFGCLAGDITPLMDDGIECTMDYCDEVTNRILHDAAECECDGDRTCVDMHNSPCSTSACDLTTFTCNTTRLDAGTPCDDEKACTQNTTCDAEGRCLVDEAGGGSFNHTFCNDADGFFCNGEERCEPTGEGSDPETGCVSGTEPQPSPVDDGLDCTSVFCDESADQVIHSPGPTCECRTDADCRQGDCLVYTCDETFTCVPSGDDAPNDTPCNDGIACTGNDVCNDGSCVGTPANLYCDLNAGCPNSAVCTPEADSADPVTGCLCADE